MSDSELQFRIPPPWAARLRGFLRRTCLHAVIVAVLFFLISFVAAAFASPKRGMDFWSWIFVISMSVSGIGATYGIGGLLLALFLPSLMQFSLRGLLITILTIGACVSAMISSSLYIRIGGVVVLLIGFILALYMNWRTEAQYRWPEK